MIAAAAWGVKLATYHHGSLHVNFLVLVFFFAALAAGK